MSKILITYCTKTGTTKEIGERVALILSRMGIEVDVLALKKVKDFTPYTGVIIGSPIYRMKVLMDLESFVVSRSLPRGKVFGLFFVSYIIKTGRIFWRNYIQKKINQVSSNLSPRITGVFGGKLSWKMPWIANFIFGVPSESPADLRDWTKIDAWSEEVFNAINFKEEDFDYTW